MALSASKAEDKDHNDHSDLVSGSATEGKHNVG